MKIAFVTGTTGQDGSYLVDLLLAKGYEVHGLIRQSTQFTPDKWGHLRQAMASDRFHVHYGDVMDSSMMRMLIDDIRPDEVYHLAAQSHVGLSFEQPENTCEATAMGTLKVLEAIRRSKPDCRVYFAGSSEQFGKVLQTPQDEDTPFYPRSPYGCAKTFGCYLTRNYREAYGMFAVSGICFNHESERRGEGFVTRKITRAVGRIAAGTQRELVLGNTDSRRDWGYAPDYVAAMWMMLQRDEPEDFVIGMGEQHTVKEFVELAFGHAGLDPDAYVRTDERYVRPSEVELLVSNPKRAHEVLGWKSTVGFEGLVRRMVEHDIKLALHEKEMGMHDHRTPE